MSHSNFPRPSFWLTSTTLVAGLISASLLLPAIARAERSEMDSIDPLAYQNCVMDMTKAKVATEDAATACGRAYHPEDLGSCVAKLIGGSVTTTEAFTACRKVRRPMALGLCVVDIRAQVKDSALPEVLKNCVSSLQPDRYASCVLGLNHEKVPTPSAIAKCIDAGSFPVELDPTFIPN